MIKFIRNPDVFHGKNRKINFFEGWYFKLVQPNNGDTYCFIPGVFMSREENQSHSFIQVLKGSKCDFSYLRFKEDEFKASDTEFDVKLGVNSFSLKGIQLNINEKQEKICGSLYFKNIIKWPDTSINPGSMGFYNYLDFMECYSQVCAMDGDIIGKLNINGKDIDFTGGKLYVEKNWGKAFPYSYIWAQGNSFENVNASLSCSIGHIPLPKPFKSFTGFLIGLYVKEGFYKFTTINRSKLSIGYEKNKVILETENKNYNLKVEAIYEEAHFMNLYAPYDGSMIPTARETLSGKLKVTLYDKKGKETIFKECCCNAGVEFSKNYTELVHRI
ncbi:tocopherol cyclase family protein [Clostridium sp. C8-1-8]|uniref:tocopherol cyclase family protein n=1 Tax=Clostridium sp. C8-1-8 TaxID=2698831 RepID=UPI00136B555B|nr:tocopherol cyclase family protein [Clostridium sp. C8-1-8]